MVEAVRAGNSLRAVAREFRVSLGTVQRWVRRAGRADLDRVEWTDHPSIPHTFHRTPPEVEARVLGLRRELQDVSALGEYGSVAIHRAWPIATWGSPPAIRTIGRILERRGALDRRRRVRRPPPPRGWYLPAVARGEADCDCFDIIAGLVLQGGPEVEVLTGLALHGGLPDAWPEDGMTTGRVHTALQARWRAEGLPSYAQFDNDTRFQGPHQFPDVVGRVPRLCLQLGVIPRVHPSPRPELPGCPRKLQRPVAGQGLEPVPLPLADRPPGSLRRAHRRGPAARDSPRRRGPSPAPVPNPVGVRPRHPALRPRHLPPPDGRAGSGHPARARVRRRFPLAAPPGPGRGEAPRWTDPVLRPPTAGPARPAPPPRGAV